MPRAGMKSPFNTIKLFKEVVTNICWLPKQAAHKFCCNPPTVPELVEMISDVILTIDGNGQEDLKRQYVRFLYHIKQRTPDQDYLVQTLGIIIPKHEIFSKGYRSK